MAEKNAYLRTYSLKLLPNVKEEFALRGNSLRVVSSAVTLYFEARDGSSAFFLEAGEQINFNDAIFEQFDIFHLSASEITIMLAVGEGAQLNSAKIAGQVAVNGIVETTTKGVPYGASFVTINNLTANVAEQVVSPAANTNGLLILNAQYLSGNNTAQSRTSLLAKSSAPSTNTDGDAILTPQNYNLIGTLQLVSGTLVTPVRISAGKGLYFIGGQTETFASRSVLYTLL